MSSQLSSREDEDGDNSVTRRRRWITGLSIIAIGFTGAVLLLFLHPHCVERRVAEANFEKIKRHMKRADVVVLLGTPDKEERVRPSFPPPFDEEYTMALYADESIWAESDTYITIVFDAHDEVIDKRLNRPPPERRWTRLWRKFVEYTCD
jgi:hypothetical protein